MSDLGSLSRVHGNFDEFADLVDETIAELQIGHTNGVASKRLCALLGEVASASGDEASLRALTLESLLLKPTGDPLDDFADLADKLADPEAAASVQQRLGKLSAHLEDERAVLSHRLRRG